MASATDPDFSYEDNLKRIQQILDNLQGGRSGFEAVLNEFQEATLLIEKCRSYLDDAELVVRQVSATDSQLREVDFQ